MAGRVGQVLQLAMTGVLMPGTISEVTGVSRAEVERIIDRNPDVKKFMRRELRTLGFDLSSPFWERG